MFLPEKFHEQRSLAGYSPWDCKGSNTTEYAHGIEKNVTNEPICRAGIENRVVGSAGEGKGSCLENPRDGGGWWAACLWGHTESDTTEAT